jgi:hypothetical protein
MSYSEHGVFQKDVPLIDINMRYVVGSYLPTSSLAESTDMRRIHFLVVPS